MRETQCVWHGLHTFIKAAKVPRKKDAERCIIESVPDLDTRSWKDVKFTALQGSKHKN